MRLEIHRTRLGYECWVGRHEVLLRKLPRSGQLRYWAVEVDGHLRGRYSGLRKAKAAVVQWAQTAAVQEGNWELWRS